VFTQAFKKTASCKCLAPGLSSYKVTSIPGPRVLSPRSDPAAHLRCDPHTGRLYLARVGLSARQWDNPDREPDPWPEPQLADLAGRVRRALRAWEGCLRYLRLPVND
jgi:hypothetical protein